MSAQLDFLEEAKVIKREGLNKFLTYLKDDTDFFQAPASTKFHGAHEAGLLLHSLTVYDIMKSIDEMLDLGLPKESIAICGLFHDVCKTNFYEIDDRAASSAQVNFLLDLCSKAKMNPPPKEERTAGYLSMAIDALLKKEPIPEFKPTYKVNDQLPMGRGEKSVYIINKFVPLTDNEALAIRWHLGGFDPGIHFNYPSGIPQHQAMRSNKLQALLISADIAGSYLIDKW